MIPATTFPLLIAGALILLLLGFSIFIAYSLIKCLLPRKNEKSTKSTKAASKQPAITSTATTRTAAARSRSPFHRLTDSWHRKPARKRPSDIEMQQLPHLTPKGTYASDVDAMTIWPIYTGGASSPAAKNPSPTSTGAPLPPVALPVAAARLPQAPRLRPINSLTHPFSSSSTPTTTTTTCSDSNQHNWLSPPTAPDYAAHHAARAHILARHEDAVLLGSTSAATAACAELLETVLAHLCLAYPEVYKVRDDGGEECQGGWRGGVGWRTTGRRRKRRVWNKGTGEVWNVDEQRRRPLELVARLVEEDFGVFVLGGGGWKLVAVAALCPSGWRLSELIGRPADDTRGFWLPSGADMVSGEGVDFVRCFIQFSDMPASSTRGLADMLFVQEAKNFFPGQMSGLTLHNIMVREERHTFRRLPRSNAVVVAVRTTITPLIDLAREGVEKLVRDIESWSLPVATARGKFLWEGIVMGYCEDRLRER